MRHDANSMTRSRLFVRADAPAQADHIRAVCQRVIDGFRSPQLRIAPTLPEAADFAIEYEGCQGALTLVIIVLTPLLLAEPASFRLGPLCARCSAPALCKNPGKELLHTCRPWIRSLLSEALDILEGPAAEQR